MTEKLYLALDLGTSFLKAGVYTRDGAWAAAQPVRDERPGPGIFIQRGMLYDAILRCIRGSRAACPTRRHRSHRLYRADGGLHRRGRASGGDVTG